jgi:hypothetical protein
LILLVANGIVTALMIAFYTLPAVRSMDATLPSYGSEHAPEITLTARSTVTLHMLMQEYEREKGLSS